MKNFRVSLFLSRVVLVALFATLFIACSKEPIPESKSTLNNLVNFSFRAIDNSTLSINANANLAGEMVLVTLPMGTNLASIVPNIDIPKGATVKLNGASYTTGEAADFSSTVELVITAEAGNERHYKVLAKEGYHQIDELIYQLMIKYSIPGVGYALSRNEQSVYESGAGFAIVESGVRTLPTHLFRLASISKPFTTIAIMQLYEEGLLSIDDPIFGPGALLEEEFPTVKAEDMAARVTIRHMLSHTSGWSSDPDPMFTDSFKGQTLNQRINYMLTSPQNMPGSTYSYYNMGFGVLGKVIEKLSGKGYEQYIKEMLAPMGVTDIHVGKDFAGRRENEVVYYSQSGTNGYLNEMDVIAAAGGVIASPSEMLKVLHHVDGLPNVPDVLSPETRAMMLKKIDQYDRYALGWRTNHPLYPGASFHTGNLAGTATFWLMGPKFNCVVLCNSRSYISGFDDDIYYLVRDLIEAAERIDW